MFPGHIPDPTHGAVPVRRNHALKIRQKCLVNRHERVDIPEERVGMVQRYNGAVLTSCECPERVRIGVFEHAKTLNVCPFGLYKFVDKVGQRGGFGWARLAAFLCQSNKSDREVASSWGSDPQHTLRAGVKRASVLEDASPANGSSSSYSTGFPFSFNCVPSDAMRFCTSSYRTHSISHLKTCTVH